MVEERDRLEQGFATIGLAIEESLEQGERDHLCGIDADAEGVLRRWLLALFRRQIDGHISALDLSSGPMNN